MARLVFSTVAGASLALSLSGCPAPQVGSPCPIRESGTPEQRAADLKACFSQLVDTPFNTSLQKDVDILFLIDNSPSMTPKQRALAMNIPRFIQKIEDTGANYHVGIATSDVGTYVAPGQPWSISLGACNSYEGDDGTLQRVACNTRTGVSSEAVAACQALCPDPKFVPQGGQGFISKINGVTNVPKDIQMGRDLGPQKTFQCIALVGDGGCGVEGQLEGAKRALDGHNPMNNGFLRPNSVLAVIFITDEDDCSVALNRRSENDPVTMDCPAPNKDAPAACFNADYRCMARSVVCNEPLNTPGAKTNCVERDNSYLERVDNYVRFFSSLRPANKLLISGIWTLPRLDRGGKFIVTQRQGSTRTEGLNRAEGADAGCVYVADANVFGRPQIRLSKFASQFKDAIEISVCDVDKYPAALDSIANAIKTKLEANCLPAVPKTSGGKPLCLVGDVDVRTPNNAPDVAFPVCSDTCCNAWANSMQPTKDDPAIQTACRNETTEACYCALPSKVGQCAEGAVFGVWRRGGADGPPDKVTNVKCAGQ
ncbi:MAG: hypothetical protein RMK29_06375 [Myxococcales bacterium]|nr:hypothetical protein [Myxococcota bacterium]MDW8281318.1 hypothetical protein [Myxococcales bacterium]